MTNSFNNVCRKRFEIVQRIAYKKQNSMVDKSVEIVVVVVVVIMSGHEQRGDVPC